MHGQKRFVYPLWPGQSLGEYSYSLFLFGDYSRKQAAIEVIKQQSFF